MKKLPRFAEERKDILGWDVKECGQNNVPKSKLLGKGGNGIAFAHVLMNHHYAVKLVIISYIYVQCVHKEWGVGYFANVHIIMENLYLLGEIQ